MVTVARVRVAGETEPGASVSVNSIAVEPEANGSFRLILALAPGNSTITALATDLVGNSASTSVSVTYNDPAPGLRRTSTTPTAGWPPTRPWSYPARLLVVASALGGLLFVRYWKLRRRP